MSVRRAPHRIRASCPGPPEASWRRRLESWPDRSTHGILGPLVTPLSRFHHPTLPHPKLFSLKLFGGASLEGPAGALRFASQQGPQTRLYPILEALAAPYLPESVAGVYLVFFAVLAVAMGSGGATFPTAAPAEGAFADASEPSLQPAANAPAIIITIILCDVCMRLSSSV